MTKVSSLLAIVFVGAGFVAGLPAYAQHEPDDSSVSADTTAEAVEPAPLDASSEEQQPFEETMAPEVELFEGEPSGAKAEPAAGTESEQTGAPTPDEGSDVQEPGYWTDILDGLGPTGDTGADASDADGSAVDESASETPPPLTSTVSYIKGFSALLVVLALILGCYALVRRYGKGTPFLAGAGLANVIGRIYLDPRSSLHFVRVGAKVLVVGVTRNGISRVAELDADALQAETEAPEPSTSDEEEDTGERFASHLRERTVSMLERESAEDEDFDDSEIVSLRDDIQRLQKTLRDPSGEENDE